MITLTTSAVAAVKAALSRAADAEGVRVVAAAGARHTVRYLMHLETAARDGDTVIEQGGLKVFIDGSSWAATQGVRIDFAASDGFVFEDQPAPVAPAGARLRH